MSRGLARLGVLRPDKRASPRSVIAIESHLPNFAATGGPSSNSWLTHRPEGQVNGLIVHDKTSFGESIANDT